MKLVMDKVGRLVIPKSIRDALGLESGAVFDISVYGEGVQLIPHGRVARLLQKENGRLVATSETAIDDETVFALIDAARR